jgi:protein-S-isoprenylcysteine O-methyltransferase Ste14
MQTFPFPGGPIVALSFWAAFAAWVVPEIVAWKVRRSGDFTQSRDQGSLYLIVILWWGGIALAFLFSLLLPQSAITRHRMEIFAFGICLMLLGIALRWYSAAVLGKYFTFDVAIRSNQTLIEVGPYRYIRHPSYSGALLSLLGFGLALGNVAGLTAALLCMGLAYAYRIRVEETALSSALGQSYQQYRKRTWCLVPFLF